MRKDTIVQTSMPLDGVCQITLNRPEKRNALDGQVIQEWIESLQTCAADKNIRLIIFTGNGAHFCAGADIAWMQKMALCSHAENVKDAMQLALLLKTIYTIDKPTLALVQGAVMGGALGVVAATDMVIAADNASFCFSETKIGLTPSVISPYAIAAMGARTAKYYFLTAEKFTPEDALRCRLVQRIVAAEQLMIEGLNFAEQLLKNSPHALLEAKKLIRSVLAEKYSDELIKFTAEHLAHMRATHDAQEGLQAFLQKRAPVWE